MAGKGCGFPSFCRFWSRSSLLEISHPPRVFVSIHISATRAVFSSAGADNLADGTYRCDTWPPSQRTPHKTDCIEKFWYRNGRFSGFGTTIVIRRGVPTLEPPNVAFTTPQSS